MSSNPCKKILSADVVVPIDGPPLIPGFVVMEEGMIAEVCGGRPPDESAGHFRDAALIPGLVNAHTHLGCAFLRGSVPHVSFVPWMSEGIAPRVLGAARDQREIIDQGAVVAAQELLEGGVVVVGDSFFLDSGRVALEKVGLKGIFFQEYFGSMAEDIAVYAERVSSEIRITCEQRHGDSRILSGLAPHAPYTCPDLVLRTLAQESRRNHLPLTIHVAESREEDEMFRRQSGAMWSLFAAGDKGRRYQLGGSPLSALKAAGLLAPGTLVVHGVHLDSADLDDLAATQTSLVTCPGSNLRLAVGMAPVAAALQRGINVALGTDSPASTGKLDLFEEMRLMLNINRMDTGRADGLQAIHALKAATLGGAKALGFEKTHGSLSVGKAADLCLVDLSRPRHRPWVDPIETIVWSCQSDDVLRVWIDGREVYTRSRT